MKARTRTAAAAAFVALFILSCRSAPLVLNPSLLFQDFYFNGNSVQIQGRASLGPARVPIDNNSAGKPGGNPEKNPASTEKKAVYQSLDERRADCQKRAVQNASTKFVALTMADRQDQTEWELRLKLGARGRWHTCLEEAHLLGTFFDDPGTCRVVVLFPCLPQDY